MEKCIFCEIIANRIPSYKLYEDDNVICMLDINPLTKGHCLVIPKKHYKDIFEIDEVTLANIILAAKKVSMQIRKKLGAMGINILHASGKEAQQSVFHFHLHLVPRFKGDNLDTWPKSEYKEKSLNEIYEKIKG